MQKDHFSTKSSYSYNIEDPESGGCTPCFCMGVTRDCSASNLNRVQVGEVFRN